MKTTENISLAGYAFVIETDAYGKLDTYLNDIRNCFSDDPSAEEIVSDIEERIAELLREKCMNGMVVDMPMVLDIMKRIGNPEELAGEETSCDPSVPESRTSEKAEKKSTRSKRLYRNTDERVIGGVCSGLGIYFGVDKVIFRLIFLILFFIGIVSADEGPYVILSFLAYICLWIAMPAARTAEQKREMKGKPLNLDSYRSKGFEFEKEVREVAESPAGQTARRAGGVFLGMLLLIIGLGGLLGCIFIPSLPTIIGNEFTEEIIQYGHLAPEDQLGVDLVINPTFWGLVLVMLSLFCVLFLYNGIMLIFDLKSPSWRPGLILFVAWIISIFVLAGWVIKTVADALPMIM